MNETERQYIKISDNLMILRFDIMLYDPDIGDPKEIKRLQVFDTQLNTCTEEDFIALLSYFNQNPNFLYEIHEMKNVRKMLFSDWIKANKIGWYQKYRLLIPE